MKISKVLLILAIVAVGCSKERETAKGYKYTLVTKGDGKQASVGSFLIMDLMYKDGKDSVIYDNRKNQIPEVIQVPDTVGMSQEEGLNEVFRLLTKGDSVVMVITAQTLFEKTFRQMVPANIDPLGKYTFYMKVHDVLDSAGFAKLEQEIIAKRNELAQKDYEERMASQREHAAKQLAVDTVLIDNYLKEKSIVARKTASGLRYVVKKQGTGKNAQVGQTVKIVYAGYLLSGKCFDTSIESVAKENGVYNPNRPYGPYELQAGANSVIAGWEEAILLMNKGCKLTVYIPSTLAYGQMRRSEDIVENSVLMFDMELVDIK